MTGKKTVFLDRDGTINVEKNYLFRTEDFEFINRAPEAIRLLNRRNYRVIVVTNQAGVARGYYTEEDVNKLHSYINKELQKRNAHIDAFYYCPHHPSEGIEGYKKICRCRKPKTGMFEQAGKDFPIARSRSWMIGDNQNDIKAGKEFGLRTILVRTGYGSKLEREGFSLFDYIADDLYQAVKCTVLKNEQ